MSPQTVLAIVSKVDPIRVSFPMSGQEYPHYHVYDAETLKVE